VTKNQRHQRRNNLNHPGEEKEKQKTTMKVVRENVLGDVATKLATILNTKVEMAQVQ
jgi:hypothetical protein